MGQFDKEASKRADYASLRDATLCTARPDPSLRKSGLLGMTT
jgi:hypothetical protein